MAASTSVGSAAAAARAAARSTPCGALHEAHLGEPELGVVVLGVLGQRLLVGRGGTDEVAALDGVEGLLVQRRQGLGVVGTLDRLELHPAGDAVLHGRLEQLVEHRAHLALGRDAREQRDRLALEQAEGRRHAGLPEGLHEQRLERLEQLGRGRQVGAEHEQPTLERCGDPHHGVEQLAGLRVGRSPQHQHTGHLQGAVERLLEVARRRPRRPARRARRALTVGRIAGQRRRPASRLPAVAAVGAVIPATEDRSTAPRVPAGGVVSLMVPILSKG